MSPQVTILVMSTIAALRGGLDAQPKEICDFFTVIMVFINVLQVFNLTAMSVIYFCPLVQDTNSQFSSSLVVSVALTLGIIVSIIFAWLGCLSYSEFLFRASIAGLLACVVAAFSLCIAWLCSSLHLNHPTQASPELFSPSVMRKREELWGRECLRYR